MEDMQRRVQFRERSCVITIPSKIVSTLGIKKDQYLKFAVVNGKIVIKPGGSKITKKDLAEADKDTAHLEDKEVPSYVTELSAALGRDASQSRLEKLRMK